MPGSSMAWEIVIATAATRATGINIRLGEYDENANAAAATAAPAR